MEQVGSILGVMAGKGGVGKSAFSVLLAHAFVKLGFRVGLLDADLYGPSIVQMTGSPPPQASSDALLPAVAHGIHLMSMAFFNGQSASFVRAPIANQMILHFIEGIDWGALDILIIDFPPGTGDIQLTLMQKLSLTAALLITTPPQISASDVRLAADMARLMNVPLLGVIENMGSIYHSEIARLMPLFEGDAAKTISTEFDIPLLAKLPFDRLVAGCLDRGEDPFQIDSPLITGVKNLALDLSRTLFHEASL